jgi:hypothetical protein
MHKQKACTYDQIWSKCVGYWDAPRMLYVLLYYKVMWKIITWKIWGSYSSVDGDASLLGCDAMWNGEYVTDFLEVFAAAVFVVVQEE